MSNIEVNEESKNGDLEAQGKGAIIKMLNLVHMSIKDVSIIFDRRCD